MSALVPNIIRRFETVTETIAGAHTPLRRAAQNATQRALWAARVELSMQALTAAFVALLEVDEAGQPVNFDARTGRILIAVPWGKAGGVTWGLRSSEQRTLAQVLRCRAAEPWALVYFERQAWFVEGFTRNRAEAYLRRQPITIAEYRAAWDVCADKWTSTDQRRDGTRGSAIAGTR